MEGPRDGKKKARVRAEPSEELPGGGVGRGLATWGQRLTFPRWFLPSPGLQAAHRKFPENNP